MRDSLPLKTGGRRPKNVVLVVTEGETEKNYFDSMKKRGSNIEIVMLRSRQPDPIRVVDLCIAKMRELRSISKKEI